MLRTRSECSSTIAAPVGVPVSRCPRSPRRSFVPRTYSLESAGRRGSARRHASEMPGRTPSGSRSWPDRLRELSAPFTRRVPTCGRPLQPSPDDQQWSIAPHKKRRCRTIGTALSGNLGVQHRLPRVRKVHAFRRNVAAPVWRSGGFAGRNWGSRNWTRWNGRWAVR